MKSIFFFSPSSSSSSLLVTLCLRLFFDAADPGLHQRCLLVCCFCCCCCYRCCPVGLVFLSFVWRRPRYPRIGKRSSILASVILIHGRYCMLLHFGLHNPFVKANVRFINLGALDTSKIMLSYFLLQPLIHSRTFTPATRAHPPYRLPQQQQPARSAQRRQ
jgi:hypothetical protein